MESLRYLTEKGLLRKNAMYGSEEEFQNNFHITKLGQASFKGKDLPESDYESEKCRKK